MAEPWQSRSRAGTWPLGRRAGRHALPVPSGAAALPDAALARLRDWAVAEAAPGRFLAWLAVTFGLGIVLYFAAEREPELWAAGGAAAASVLVVLATRGRGYSALVALGFSALAVGFFTATLRAHRVDHPILRQTAYGASLSGFVERREERERSDRIVLRVHAMEGTRAEREQGDIPWDWIVDETRSIERVSTWDDPEDYALCCARSYRRDFWNLQPVRCEVWSEKGTVRGVLAPVLDEYAVGFNAVHGYSSATQVHAVAEDVGDGRELVILYVGDYDPSGMHMSEEDLPKRFDDYGGAHVTVDRIALTRTQLYGLPSFPAADKKKDTRFMWFRDNYGTTCWELDAMDPNDLRNCVEEAIKELIDPVAWERCDVVNKAEQESLKDILSKWRG